MRGLRALPIVVACLSIASLTTPPASAGDLRVDGKLVSEAASGPPLEVASSERVDNLNADRLDGFDATDFAPADHTHDGVPYANVLVVSPSGGDFTSIQAAIDSATDASAANPYLIWVGPGVYDEVVTTTEGIDVHGAGRDLVVIRRTASSAGGALVTLQGDGEPRSLTVEHSLTLAEGVLSVYLYGISISSGSPRLVDVAVRATADCNDPEINYGVTGLHTIGGASPTIERVSVEARVTGSQAAGICNAEAFIPVNGGVTVLDDVTLVAEGTTVAPGNSSAIALYPQNSVAIVRDSVLMATGGESANRALQTSNPPGSTSAIRVAHSQVIGDVQGTDIVCVGAYDADFAALGAGCT